MRLSLSPSWAVIAVLLLSMANMISGDILNPVPTTTVDKTTTAAPVTTPAATTEPAKTTPVTTTPLIPTIIPTTTIPLPITSTTTVPIATTTVPTTTVIPSSPTSSTTTTTTTTSSATTTTTSSTTSNTATPTDTSSSNDNSKVAPIVGGVVGGVVGLALIGGLLMWANRKCGYTKRTEKDTQFYDFGVDDTHHRPPPHSPSVTASPMPSNMYMTPTTQEATLPTMAYQQPMGTADEYYQTGMHGEPYQQDYYYNYNPPHPDYYDPNYAAAYNSPQMSHGSPQPLPAAVPTSQPPTSQAANGFNKPDTTE